MILDIVVGLMEIRFDDSPLQFEILSAPSKSTVAELVAVWDARSEEFRELSI